MTTYPEYKRVPNLNTAPDYRDNNTFKMHDKAMNYYYGFYPSNGTPPVGNDLQNFYLTPLNQNVTSYVDLADTTEKLASFGVVDEANYVNTVNNCSTCKVPGSYAS